MESLQALFIIPDNPALDFQAVLIPGHHGANHLAVRHW